MKTNLIILVITVSSLILSTKSNANRIERVRITINNNIWKDSQVKVVYSDMLNDILPISEFRLDSLGYGFLDFEIKNAKFAYLKILDKTYDIFLAPGYNLIVESEIGIPGIKFSGAGSKENNYLIKSAQIFDEISRANGKFILSLEPDAFLKRYDSLEEIIYEFDRLFWESIKDESTLKCKELIEKKVRLKLDYQKLFYAYLRKNNELNEESIAIKNGYTYSASKLPDAITSTINNIPFEEVYLTSSTVEYSKVMEMLLEHKIYLPNINVKKWEKERDFFPVKTSTLIQRSGFPEPFMEYLLARNISHWINRHAIGTSIDSLTAAFKLKYPRSSFILLLEKEYNKVSVVTVKNDSKKYEDPNREKFQQLVGQEAVDFFGISTTGTKVHLSDFKGKVVYIDIWATWCGPCREEVPYAKDLKEQFRGNEEVVFLNVSIDQNISAWKKLLAADKKYEGVHIIVQGEELNFLNKSYLITYIPRYVLINKAGKIVDMNAARPSSGLVKGQLMRLISQR